ncbi:alpha-ketoglutarate decarboxylase, partial [Psychroserpens sp.]|uniref:alpha-ketoglutarate decarboxylase n=1 Tax=Psychroserpens sp. TaxID=2020870 RepID=UPI003C768ACF
SLTILLFTISISPFLEAQDIDEPVSFWNNVRYGGSIKANFANGFFSGTLAPIAIYQFNREFGLGLGLVGTYTSQKNVFNATVIGASVISLFDPIPAIQVSGEFEQSYVIQNFSSNEFEDRDYFVPALYVGIGYNANNVTFGIRYDLFYNRNRSLNVDPWVPFVRILF